MPVEFFELPSVSGASVTPVSTGTGYCTASDVASLNKIRSAAWGTGGNPNLNDVEGYILMIAGQIDASLIARGVAVPINTASFPEAEGLLAGVNAWGAAWMVEEASQVSENVDRVKAAYDAALAMLQTAKLIVDTPSDQQRAQVRAPFITYQPPEGVFDPTREATGGWSGDGISPGGTNSRRLPYFARGMRF